VTCKGQLRNIKDSGESSLTDRHTFKTIFETSVGQSISLDTRYCLEMNSTSWVGKEP